MSSENLALVAFGVTLFAVNAFLGAPIASKIAGFFARVLPSKSIEVTKVAQGESPKVEERQPAQSRG